MGLHPGIVGARNENGYLIVGPVSLPSRLYPAITTQATLVFHDGDYFLFYLNVRNNVRLKVQAYLPQRQQVQYPLITSSNTAAGKVGILFSYQIEAVNTASDFSAVDLPDGLSLDPLNGLIAGTPTSISVFSVVLTAGNTSGSSKAELTIIIY